MSVRNLDFLFRPKSVALFGATREARSVGKVLAENLFAADFDGAVMPVHSELRSIQGVYAFPSLEDLPITPDLAVIATPPDSLPKLIAELGARGTRAAVIVTTGIDDSSREAGVDLRQQILEASRPYCLRIVGPACLGVLVPALGLNASYAHLVPRKGDLAFVTQSGSVLSTMLDWAAARGIGFSMLASLGDMTDVDFGDVLDFLAMDPSTRSILLYVEDIADARKFMSAARVAARLKPVIVFKALRREAAAGEPVSDGLIEVDADAVYEAAFRRAGLLPVATVDEMVAAARTLATGTKLRGERLAILANGSGSGRLAAKTLAEFGSRPAQLSEATLDSLAAMLPAGWARHNPVNIFSDASADRYASALGAVLKDEQTDAVLVLNAPSAVGDTIAAAKAIVDTPNPSRKPILTVWIEERSTAEARSILTRKGIANHDTIEQAVAAFIELITYRRNQQILMETPASIPELFERDAETARRIIDDAIARQRQWLTEPETKAVLAAYGLPVVETRIAGTPENAAEAAEAIGFPVTLQILTPDLAQKSDVGGIALDLEDAKAVRAAASRMQRRATEFGPDVRVSGFSVHAMIKRSSSRELGMGMVVDPQFGPVILFNSGKGRSDRAVALPPLNLSLAHQLMAETRVSDFLDSNTEPDLEIANDIALALVKLAQLIAERPEITYIDINPLLLQDDGVVVFNARMRIAPTDLPAAARLAIRPYPSELEHVIALRDGTELLLRPIRPEDEPALQRFFSKLSPEDVRLRFFTLLKELDHPLAVRLTQLDYDREMALIAVNTDAAETDIWGVVRISADPDITNTEYAVTVRSDLKGFGLGRLLMEEILSYCEYRGIGEISGSVLRANAPMLGLIRKLGFEVHADPDEPGVMKVTKQL